LLFWIGALIGAALPPISLWIILQAKPEYTVIQRIDPEYMFNLSFQILSMGMLANGIVFFAGIRFNKDDLAQGVLISSIFWLIAIVFIKFIWQA
jgi:hypothetical protein